MNKVCVFIDKSENYPARILQQLIYEYCTIMNFKTIEDLLKEEKHRLYHKRIKTVECCKCTDSLSTFFKFIPEKQWEALFAIKQGSKSYCCQVKKCCNFFIPKKIDTCDLSAALSLVLNIPSILKLAITRLYKEGFDGFVSDNKHTIFHSMERKWCCKCNQVPIEKALFDQTQWEKLFMKNENKACSVDISDCYCQFSVRKDIKYSDMEEVFWCKLFHVAGPISVFDKIRQDAFLSFLNWTVNDKPLQRALTELMCMIEDAAFQQEMLPCISSCDLLVDNLTKQVDAQEWVSRHEQLQKVLFNIIMIIQTHLDVTNIEVYFKYWSNYFMYL